MKLIRQKSTNCDLFVTFKEFLLWRKHIFRSYFVTWKQNDKFPMQKWTDLIGANAPKSEICMLLQRLLARIL